MSTKGKRPKFEFALRQRVVVTTDLSRSGVIMKRSARKYTGGTLAYLVKKDHNGESEWYPGFSLAATESEAANAPTEIRLWQCAFGDFHGTQAEADACDGTIHRKGDK